MAKWAAPYPLSHVATRSGWPAALAKQMREADARGESLGLSDDELASSDALETNDSAVAVLGAPSSARSPEKGSSVRDQATKMLLTRCSGYASYVRGVHPGEARHARAQRRSREGLALHDLRR